MGDPDQTQKVSNGSFSDLQKANVDYIQSQMSFFTIERKGDKGDKGESAKVSPTSVVTQTNWKQCVWKSVS